MVIVKLVDGKDGQGKDITKTFEIQKMKATKSDSFAFMAVRALFKDGIVFPEDLMGSDIRNTISNLLQNGRVETEKKSAKNANDKILRNLIGIARSALSNLDEFERTELLDKLLSTITFANGILRHQLSYAACDDHIENFTTIYKLAWEAFKVNFPGLSFVKD